MPSTRLHVALIGAGRMAQTHAAVLATIRFAST